MMVFITNLAKKYKMNMLLFFVILFQFASVDCLPDDEQELLLVQAVSPQHKCHGIFTSQNPGLAPRRPIAGRNIQDWSLPGAGLAPGLGTTFSGWLINGIKNRSMPLKIISKMLLHLKNLHIEGRHATTRPPGPEVASPIHPKLAVCQPTLQQPRDLRAQHRL
jgi:hypothetical protein